MCLVVLNMCQVLVASVPMDILDSAGAAQICAALYKSRMSAGYDLTLARTYRALVCSIMLPMHLLVVHVTGIRVKCCRLCHC